MGGHSWGLNLEHATSLVYRFEYLDNKTGQWMQSDAFATPHAINRWHALAMRTTECAVPASRVDAGGIFLDGPQPPVPLADQLIDCVI
jgi:hypothetical protein